MLFLLRKIRRKLISTDNKVVTYLLYAIGEIILVVVGILIAVQIDGWNEQRKKDQAISELLAAIQQDILVDIEQLDLAIENYHWRDSLIDLMVSGKFEAQDFAGLEGADLRSALFTFAQIQLHRENFEEYIRQVDKNSKKYDSLTFSIKNLYKDLGQNLEAVHERYKDNLYEYNKFKRDHFDWYSDFYWKGALGAEELQFYVDHPAHKNFVADQIRWYRNITIYAQRFKEAGVMLYQQIGRQLQQDMAAYPSAITHYEINLPADSLARYIGKYVVTQNDNPKIRSVSDIDTLIISTDEDNQLMAKFIYHKVDADEYKLKIKSPDHLFGITVDFYFRKDGLHMYPMLLEEVKLKKVAN